MLLAYAYCFGTASGTPELCIIPSKPDQFSCPVRVHSLVPTTSAICRLSPTEGIKVYDNAGPDTLVIEPMLPSKLYLTPSQHDRPGFSVWQVSVTFKDKNQIQISYRQTDKDEEWKLWQPNQSAVT